MRRLQGALTGLGAGAPALLAPAGGRRRRARLRERAEQITQTSRDALATTRRDVRERPWRRRHELAVDAPAGDVYRLGSSPERLRRLMSHLARLEPLDESRSRWTARGPAGVELSSMAGVVDAEPGHCLALDGGLRRRLRRPGPPQPGGGRPPHPGGDGRQPAGALGHGVAALRGDAARHAVDEEMLRPRSLPEDGRTTANGRRVDAVELLPGGTPETTHCPPPPVRSERPEQRG